MKGTDDAANREDSPADLADRVECFTEDQIAALYGVLPSTLNAWRKRGLGPECIRAGTNFLYPHSAVKKDLQSRVRTRQPMSTKVLL